MNENTYTFTVTGEQNDALVMAVRAKIEEMEQTRETAVALELAEQVTYWSERILLNRELLELIQNTRSDALVELRGAFDRTKALAHYGAMADEATELVPVGGHRRERCAEEQAWIDAGYPE